MTQQMDAFLRDFVGYGEDEVKVLDIEWGTVSERLNAGFATPEFAGRPVLVYQPAHGGVRYKPLTKDACRRCRDAMLADIQQLA